jgi:putative drug exporter of the RND superfamily
MASAGKKRLPLSLRRPRTSLVVALVLILGLGWIGRDVEDKLNPSSLDVPGTDANRANKILRQYFGDSAPFAILLQGPAKQIDEQGPALVHRLRAADPDVTTVSPWDKGKVGNLRPAPNKALVLADFHVSVNHAVRYTVDELNEILDEKVTPPVEATQTGFATLSRAIQDESIAASERSELIALPILLFVLLLVFRSPVAALIPLSFGAITVISSRGVLTLLSSAISIDGFALTVSTMMGLALGVDYALLMVSRFREELRDGSEPYPAAVTTRRTAGRTTVFAGSTLFLAMVVSVPILPGALLVSLAVTMMVVIILSVSVATVVAPALMALLGSNVNRWRIGRAGAAERSAVMTFVDAALRRPVAAAAVIGGIVLILAVPAIGLKTGPPSTEQLPSSNDVREDFDVVQEAIGPGYEAPFVVVAATEDGTMTEHERLDQLSRWQRKIAKDPAVQAVIGPEQVAKRTKPLKSTGNELRTSNEKGGELYELNRLGPQLARAAKGVSQIRDGFAEAASGAGLLSEGSGNAEAGALQIAGGLGQAIEGGEKAVSGITRIDEGSGKVEEGSGELAEGQEQVKSLTKGLVQSTNDLARRIRKNALKRNKELTAELKSLEATNPELAKAVRRSETLTAYIQQVQSEAKSASDSAQSINQNQGELVKGSNELSQGTTKLHAGTTELNDEAPALPSGLAELQDGTFELANGINELQGGSEELQSNLSDGFRRAYPLQRGLRRASVRVTRGAGSLSRKVDQINAESPGLFDSGYFVLSAVDGAPPADREKANEVISLKNGGQGAAITVISKYTFNTQGSKDLDHRLKRDARGLGRDANVTAGVAGGAAQLTDYDAITKERIPLVVIAITLITLLMMIVIVRAPLLAALAVVLNLATVGVAFGVIVLLFGVPDGYPGGGHTYVDAIGAVAMFGVVFGLSIDYAVFLLMRMKESYDRGGDNAAAISEGLEKTARVITGAAAIMMAVFIAFAAAPIATVSQLGIGLTVAVLLDATVVRIVLLPALMLLIGERVWRVPGWLDRILPELDVEGADQGPKPVVVGGVADEPGGAA